MLERRFGFEELGGDRGGFGGASERARDDAVELEPEPTQRDRRFASAAFAFRQQRAVVVGDVGLAAFDRDPVSHDVQVRDQINLNLEPEGRVS